MIKLGKLYGLGIGFGDLELLIFKVYWILIIVLVIVYFILENSKFLVWAIVVNVICFD